MKTKKMAQLCTAGLVAIGVLGFSAVVRASDHIDSPVADHVEFPEFDLTDLYAWAPQKGQLAVSLNLHMNAQYDTPFSSEDVEYRFRLRPVVLSEVSGSLVKLPQLVQGTQETTISCTVNTQNKKAQCNAGEYSVVSKVNNPWSQRKRKPAMRLFAGNVVDSFFLDIDWTIASITQSTDAFDPNVDASYLGPVQPATPVNSLEGFGSLNITLLLDTQKILGETHTHYIVAADLLYDGDVYDRVGRPEVTNMLIRAPEIKTMYNAADTFNLTALESGTFSAYIGAAIAGWDRLDKKSDWDEISTDALVSTFLLDGLVVNIKNKCQFKQDNYFDMERSTGILSHYASTCGGRTPRADVIDSLTSLLVAGPRALKDSFGDGVSKVSVQPKRIWPYFVPLKSDE